MTETTPSALASLKYKLMVKENYDLRRRLQLQDEVLRHNVSARDAFDTLSFSTLQMAKKHAASLRKQHDAMKNERRQQENRLADKTRSGVGLAAATRQAKEQEQQWTKQSVERSISFLRSVLARQIIVVALFISLFWGFVQDFHWWVE